jgi:GT2 family glycosyltransferase
MTPSCSVILVGRDEPDRVNEVLRALAAQDASEVFEVIVVLDGRSRRSAEVLDAWTETHAFASLRCLEQDPKGIAASRNRAVFVADAPIVLFVAENVVPAANVVSSHLRRHRSAGRVAVLGCVDPVRLDTGSLLRSQVWSSLEAANDRRASVGQPLGSRDFATSTVSLRKEDFAAVGGYDPQFGSAGADEDLGYRLRRAGVRFIGAPEIRSRRDITDSERSLSRTTRMRAQADVLLARKHPEIISGLRLGRFESPRGRRAAALAMFVPWLGLLFVLARRALMRAHEWFGLRGRWQLSLEFIVAYAYWRGLKDVLGGLSAVRALRMTAEQLEWQRVDISEPLAPQLEVLNLDATCRLTIAYAGESLRSLEIDPNNPEPLLPWLVHEISSDPTTLLLIRLLAGSESAAFGAMLFESGSFDRG